MNKGGTVSIVHDAKYKHNDRVTYTSKLGGRPVAKTVDVLLYVPAGVSIKQAAHEAGVKDLPWETIEKDCSTAPSAQHRYLVRTVVPAGLRNRPKFFSPSVNTVESSS